MRGEILHYDETQGFGFITGADGRQYTFAREDFREPVSTTRATAVEFQPSGDKAKLIRAWRDDVRPPPANIDPPMSLTSEPTLLDPVPPAAPSGKEQAVPPPQPTPTQPPRRTVPSVPQGATARDPRYDQPTARYWEDTGLWHYFRRAMTAGYAEFSSRARRKEYWAFVLFSSIVLVALFALGVAIDLGTNNFDWNDDPTIIFTWALPGLWILATIIPGIAVTIRRQHDIGISGWFYLLVLVPSVGGLIIFVFTVIPSQTHENRWGPVPFGIRLPPYWTAPGGV